MRRILIVANRTLGGDRLRSKVVEHLAQGPCRFYVLVPATPNANHPLVWTEGESRALARRRLQHILHVLHRLGAEADGEVGDQRPLFGIGDILHVQQFDEIVISTLPPGVSRWIAQDLPRRVARAFALPVTHISAEPIRTGDRAGGALAPIIDLPLPPSRSLPAAPADETEDGLQIGGAS